MMDGTILDHHLQIIIEPSIMVNHIDQPSFGQLQLVESVARAGAAGAAGALARRLSKL